MLSFLITTVLQTGILGSVIAPDPVAREVGEQVFPHIFVLRLDEAQPQQEGAEGKGRIFADLGVRFWLMACAEMASANVTLALTFPAWRVLSKQRHSNVPR